MYSKMIGTLLVGTLSVGAIALTFNGEDTINNTKDFLKETTNKLELFKSNETKLVDMIRTLKSSKASLLDQINQLQNTNSDKEAQVGELNNQVSSLDARIVELEGLLNENDTELQTENDRLVDELAKANVEITKANDMVAGLQAELDTQKAIVDNIQPLSSTELDKVSMEYIVDDTKDYFEFENLTIKIQEDYQWYFGSLGSSPWEIVVHFADGTTEYHVSTFTGFFYKKIDKITYKTDAGEPRTIMVYR